MVLIKIHSISGSLSVKIAKLKAQVDRLYLFDFKSALKCVSAGLNTRPLFIIYSDPLIILASDVPISYLIVTPIAARPTAAHHSW